MKRSLVSALPVATLAIERIALLWRELQQMLSPLRCGAIR
jgi:hypothetical protein